MNKQEILSHLKNYKLKQTHSILKLGVCGSVARNEITPHSDVDIVLELSQPDLLQLAAIQSELEDLSHCKVDVIRLRPRMNEFLRKRIEKEVIYV